MLETLLCATPEGGTPAEDLFIAAVIRLRISFAAPVAPGPSGCTFVGSALNGKCIRASKTLTIFLCGDGDLFGCTIGRVRGCGDEQPELVRTNEWTIGTDCDCVLGGEF
jgi:hypothetical protein